MEVVKTWIVQHKQGRTQLYLLEDGSYIIVVPTPTGTCWTDVPENISEPEALKYILEYKKIHDESKTR
jgi:hypothetical protein